MIKPTNYPNSTDADITLLLEGTYPFVMGGVSSWVFQLMTSLPQYRFAIIFLGGKQSDYNKIYYTFPKNLVHFETHYLFDEESEESDFVIDTNNDVTSEITALHNQFNVNSAGSELSKLLQNELFSKQHLTKEKFLHHQCSWDYITNNYLQKCPHIVFPKYFWSVRNMHIAIWKIAAILKKAPKTRVLHSISTGYAGFLGALMHFEYRYPFILTEHGIYIRERRIDLLNQWCGLERQSEYINAATQEYLTNMWIRFFEVLGKIAYVAASPIISLFEAYQKEQIDNGAKKENTLVIPNGVSIAHSNFLPRNSINSVSPTIALIGRVVPIKDIKTFIKSMIIVIRAIPKAHAWIIGPTNENQEYFDECKEFVNVLGLTENIQFLGQQKIDDFLPKIDLLVLSSISEGLPLVLLEGFAAGIPAIATDVGACRELIYGKSKEDQALGESGSVVEIANPTALGKEILSFSQDASRWKKAQIAGLERVKRYYSQSHVLENYINVYEKAFQSWQG